MTTKKQLTPEQRAMLNEIVNGAFSSIAIHFIGDNLAKGIHYAADATQRTTDVTARAAGTAQVRRQAWSAQARFSSWRLLMRASTARRKARREQ